MHTLDYLQIKYARAFWISGELDTVYGRSLDMQNTFSFVRKGERSGVCRVTKEFLILLSWAGSPTKLASSIGLQRSLYIGMTTLVFIGITAHLGLLFLNLFDLLFTRCFFDS